VGEIYGRCKIPISLFGPKAICLGLRYHKIGEILCFNFGHLNLTPYYSYSFWGKGGNPFFFLFFFKGCPPAPPSVYFFSTKILCVPSFFKNTLRELLKDQGEKKKLEKGLAVKMG
jgi:hypothetical protein